MNLHALPSLVGGIANFVLGIFVYLKNKKNPVNRIFALLCLAIALWNIDLFGLRIANNEFFAIYWSKMFAIGLFLIPPLFLHFALIFTGKTDEMNKKIVYCFYGLGFFFFFIHWIGHFVSGFRYVIRQYVPQPGPMYYFYILNFFLAIGYSLFIIFSAYKSSIFPQEKNKFKYFIIAIFLGVIISSTNFLLSLGMKFYPIGYLGGITFTSFAAYSVIKYD